MIPGRERKLETDGGPFADFALDSYLSAVRLDHLFSQGQSEAAARELVFLLPPCLVEAIKHMRQIVCRDAGPIIRDREAYDIPFRVGPQLNRDCSSYWAEFQGV